MLEHSLDYPKVIVLIGILIGLNMLLKSAFQKVRIPALVGYLLVGFLVSVADLRWNLLSEGAADICTFMAKIGLVVLLFKIGLESNLEGLLKQLRRASIVWVGDVFVSGLLGFLVCYSILDLGWVASLVVGCALTATSVGISAAIWEESDALHSPQGELLLDLAELDDISAVVLMGLLFAILTELHVNHDPEWVRIIPVTLGVFLLKLLAFGGLCYAFSRFAERHVTNFFKGLESPPDPMLELVGISLIIAAVAGLLGFSLAIGAFFAGLVFSRDQEAVKMETSFLPLYDLFSPFFFIGVGMQIDPGSMVAAAGAGVMLSLTAIVGKVAADGLPVWLMLDRSSGWLIGFSMVPRAEIAMVIMQKGLSLGAVPQRIFGAMVAASAVTCVLSPYVVRRLMVRSGTGSRGSGRS